MLNVKDWFKALKKRQEEAKPAQLPSRTLLTPVKPNGAIRKCDVNLFRIHMLFIFGPDDFVKYIDAQRSGKLYQKIS